MILNVDKDPACQAKVITYTGPEEELGAQRLTNLALVCGTHVAQLATGEGFIAYEDGEPVGDYYQKRHVAVEKFAVEALVGFCVGCRNRTTRGELHLLPRVDE